MTFNRLFLIISLFISFSVYGERWVYVVSNDDRTDYFYDFDNIKRNGELIEYSELVNYGKPLMLDKLKIYSTKSQVNVDCKNGSELLSI